VHSTVSAKGQTRGHCVSTID